MGTPNRTCHCEARAPQLEPFTQSAVVHLETMNDSIQWKSEGIRRRRRVSEGPGARVPGHRSYGAWDFRNGINNAAAPCVDMVSLKLSPIVLSTREQSIYLGVAQANISIPLSCHPDAHRSREV